MKVKRGLNRSTAPQTIRLLDYCFKEGVVESCLFEDDYFVKEWYEEKIQNWCYGTLIEPDIVYDWRRWRYTLLRWCRLRSLRVLGEVYIDGLSRKQGYMSAIFPMTMQFYLRGMKEWLEYPNPNKLEIFKQRSRIHWKPMPAGLETFETDDFIAECQDIAYKFNVLPDKTKNTIAQNGALDGFVQALWQNTRKYPTYGKIRGGETST